jgi:hypothetical protein
VPDRLKRKPNTVHGESASPKCASQLDKDGSLGKRLTASLRYARK